MRSNRVAVIGAGFSGLGVAWFLDQKGFSVTLFDEKGIGGGASGMAAGLLHPYPGRQGRRSWRGQEGMAATRELIAVAEQALGATIVEGRGIIRRTWNEEQTENFRSYPDVAEISQNCFLIQSGLAIDAPRYLKGLLKACKNVSLEKRRIETLEDLISYSHVVIAAGAGSFHFAPIKASRIKGHILLCRFSKALSHSIIENGYAVLGREAVVLGSTYERDFSSEEACMEKACLALFPKACALIGEEPEVLGCRAGIRVVPVGYHPMVSRLDSRTWLFTGMGSRGLLYHALLASELAEQIGSGVD